MEVHCNRLSRREWESHTDQAHAGLQQHWDYGEAVKSLGGGVIRISCHKDERLLATAQVLRRRFGGLITDGPVWVESGTRCEELRAFRGVLRRSGVRVCAVTPPEPIGGIGFPVLSPVTKAILRIKPACRQTMQGKWRNRLRAAEQTKLRVLQLSNNFGQLRWLFDADLAQQKARGYRALPSSFSAAWLALGRSNALTLAAEKDGRTLAAMMFLRHGKSATYHLGWSDKNGRACHAHNLLLWQAAIRLSATGVETIDLGTLDTVNAPGLARFKLGTGAKPRRLGATYIMI